MTIDQSHGWKRHPLVTFFILTYGIAWALWLPIAVLRDAIPASLGFVLNLLGGLVPSAVAIVLVGMLRGRGGVRELLRRLIDGRVGLRGYLALLLLPALILASVALSAAFGGPPVRFGLPIVAAFGYLLFMIFPGTALGEELGWRGFALPRLQVGRSALAASLILGVLWGVWHFPLYVTGMDIRPLSLFVPFVLLLTASAVIYTWVYNNTHGSLLIPVLLHATSNLALTALIVEGNDRFTGPFLIYVGLSIVAAIVVTIVSGPEHLSRTHQKLETPPTPPTRILTPTSLIGMGPPSA
jgi:uncharacterized protein